MSGIIANHHGQPPHLSEHYAKSMIRLGDERFFGGDWDAAIVCYGMTIVITSEENRNSPVDPGSVQHFVRSDLLVHAYCNRAEALLRVGRYEEALADSSAALQLDAHHPKCLLRKAKALYALHRFDELLTCVQFLTTCPDPPHPPEKVEIQEFKDVMHAAARGITTSQYLMQK